MSPDFMRENIKNEELARRRETHTPIRKSRDFPSSLETRPGIPLSEHASEDALNVTTKRLVAKEPPSLCGREGMCRLVPQNPKNLDVPPVLRIQM